jgi:hypothetical protein
LRRRLQDVRTSSARPSAPLTGSAGNIASAFSYRERPDLRGRVDSADIWPEYNRHGDTLGRFWGRMLDEFPDFQFVLVDGDEVLAEGHSVPLRWDGTDDGLPAGIDGAFERAFASEEPNTLCAMAIEILPAHQSRRLSVPMLEHMKATAAREGFDSLLAPLRPSWKERYPLTPIERYVAWTRDDGLPFDPWHGLAPLEVDREADAGRYWEPNVWVLHRV